MSLGVWGVFEFGVRIFPFLFIVVIYITIFSPFSFFRVFLLVVCALFATREKT